MKKLASLVLTCSALLALAPPTAVVPDLSWPAGADILDGVFYLMHVDHSRASGTIQDYQCNTQYAYDGHTGTDLSAYNFRSMDRGIPVLAAADGVVAWVRSDQFDRNYSTPYQGQANGVIINHTDGSHTQYYHLRRHSVSVQVGEAVQQGQHLGYIGSSGASPIPHLHFEVWATPGRINVRDPLNGPCSNDDLDLGPNGDYYPGDAPLTVLDWDLFLDTNLSGNESNNFYQEDRLKERPVRPTVFGTALPTLGVWVQMQASPGARYEIRLLRPDGEVFATKARTVTTSKGVQWHVGYWPFASALQEIEAPTGTWVAELWHDNVRIGQKAFEVGLETDYAPRFYPLSGLSLVAGGTEQRHTLTLSGKEKAVTLRLEDAPGGLALDGSDLVVEAGFEGTYRNTNARIIAEDARGRADTFFVHVVDYSAPVNPFTTSQEPAATPQANSRAVAYPNPSGESARIALHLVTPAEVELALFDISGREVLSHRYGWRSTGPQVLPVDLSALPAGTYAFRVRSGTTTWTGKITRGR